MAATNYTPIQLYFSTTASAVPLAANLAQGELAINITDGKLYYEDNAGVVQVIATKGAGTIGGSTTQIQYNNAGALAGNAAMVFNNSTNVTTLTTLNLTNALGATYGGTAQSTYAQGDFLYASASNTLSKLGIGTVNYILTSTGTVPQWSAPSSIIVQTATNLAGGLAGSVPYQSALDTTTFLAIGAANRVMTSTGSAPQWVTSLTGLTGVSSSSITNTSLTSGRVVVSTTAGLQADDADLTFDGTTLSAGGFSTVGLSTLVKTVTVGNSSFNGSAVFAAATPAKLYMGTGTVTDVTSAISATNAVGAIASLGITPIAATNTSVTYTNAATLYIAGAPSAGTNITITNPYSLYVAGGASYFGGAVDFAVTPSYSGGTANGVMYLNGSKQITTGSALTFDGTNFANTGNITAGTTGSGANLVAYASTYSTNGLVRLFGTDGNNKVEFGAASATTAFLTARSGVSMIFGANDAEGMRLTSTSLYTASGINVGIGTSSPGTLLTLVPATNTAYSLHFGTGDYGTSYGTKIYVQSKNPAGTTSSFHNTTKLTSSINGRADVEQYLSYVSATAANDYQSWSTAGISQMLLDGSGNLGLGVTPSAWRTDAGPAKAVQLPGGSVWAFSTSEISLGQNYYYGTGGGRYRLVDGKISNYFQSSGEHYWQTSVTGLAGVAATNIDIMALDSSGNLGLGVTPSAWSSTNSTKAFQVSIRGSVWGNVNSTSINNNWYLASGDVDRYIATGFATRYNQGATGQHEWFTAPSGTAGDPITFTQAMTLDASGSLLVGTTTLRTTGYTTGNSQYAMETTGYGGAQWFINRADEEGAYVILGKSRGTTVNSNTVVANADTLGAIIWQGTTGSGVASAAQIRAKVDGATISASSMPGRLEFYTTPSGSVTLVERARIDSSGNLSVGDTTNSRGARLRVEGTETAYFTGYGSGYGIGLWMTPNASASGGNATAISFQNVSNSTVGSITTTASATLYNVTSDQRLKENIVDAESASSLIDSLQVRKFDWKSDGSHQRYGFVAQELVTVAPEAVHQPADPEEMMAVDYSKLVPMLVKEIQSLRKRLADAGI